MPHDVIDNRDTLLHEVVNKLLPHAEAAHFAVGFFFLSGLKAIARNLENLRQIRLLIGNTATRATIEQLAEIHPYRPAIEEYQRAMQFQNAAQRASLLAETAHKIRERLERMEPTDEDQALIQQLARLIQEGRLKVRVYTSGRLHAKAYIFDYPADRYERGVAIVGSSNLSLAGLRDNTELNVVVHGNANHEQLRQWFDRLWEEATPFEESLLNELRLSWAMNETVTPYELYLKVLYHLTKDRLEEPDVPLPADFPPLADFQWAAVKSALRILKRHNGVFISDVVGLGKTYIAAALLKWLKVREGQRALIICPAALVEMWRERFVDRYDLGAEVLSLGMLSQPDFTWEEERFQNKHLVVLDESHHLRHTDTVRYERLYQFVRSRGLPMILLTATPRNSRAWDIYNQLKLFYAEDRIELGVEPRSLRRYFQLVEAGERPLPPLLQHFLIRRTRRHIREYWPNAEINGRPVRFPERQLYPIEYSIEKTYGGFYERLRQLISPPDPQKGKLAGMNYCRFGLHHYVLPQKQRVPPYTDLARAGQRLHGLMRVLLFKRLESSVEAFRQTVAGLKERYRIFLRGLDEGVVIAGEEVEDWLKGIEPGDAERDDLLAELKKQAGKYQLADFRAEELRRDASADLETLEEMYRLVEPITPEKDAKLLRLLEWLKSNEQASQHKLLLFTQYVDTARYLTEQLKRSGICAPEEIEYADGNRNDLQAIINRFAPVANEVKGRIDRPIKILVATDVLSEGVNLQDAAVIVNYDLHFNPVRLIQRFGRIDRINSPHREIYAYNFLPELELERQLGIRAILNKRIEEIHQTIGEDAAILEPDERLNPEAMYAIYEGDGRKLEAIEDEIEKAADLEVQEAEDLIRRIKREQPELFQRIVSLPNAIRTAKSRTDPTSPAAVFFFGQAGDFYRLWIADKEGNILSDDNHSALAAIACKANEPRRPVPKDFNQVVAKLKAEFDRQYQEYLAAGGIPLRLSSAQRWALDVIRAAYNQADEKAKPQLEQLRKGWSLTPLDPRAEFALRSLRSRNPRPADAIAALQALAFEHRLDAQIQSSTPEWQQAMEPVIICAEAFV